MKKNPTQFTQFQHSVDESRHPDTVAINIMERLHEENRMLRHANLADIKAAKEIA